MSLLTTSGQVFAKELGDRPEGAIALVGPRGIGKSTLLTECVVGNFDDQEAPDASRPITVRRSPPVAYDAAKFHEETYRMLRNKALELLSENVRPAPTNLTTAEQWVKALRKLVKAVTRSRPVRIVIDDLDRVALPKDLEALLHDLREVFAVKKCQRVVASSDAINVDVLKPFVDLVLQIEGLRLAESTALLDTHYADHDERLKCLVHSASGGVPRILRQLARVAFEPSPSAVPADGVVAELARQAVPTESPAALLLRETLISTFCGDVDEETDRRAVADPGWEGSFDYLARVRRLIYSDPVQATAVLNDFRRARGLAVLEVETPAPETAVEESSEEQPPRDPRVVVLETDRLPQLVGDEFEAEAAQRAIKRMNLDTDALKAEVLSSALVTKTVHECSSRLEADLAVLDMALSNQKKSQGQRVAFAGTVVGAIVWAALDNLSSPWFALFFGTAAVLTAGAQILLSERSSAKSAERRRERLVEVWEREVVAVGIRPATRLALNKALQPILWFSLVVTDRSGLARTGDDQFVDTKSVLRFKEAERRNSVGAIGLAGPRGSGKSTLIHHKTHDRTDVVAVQVSAPVRYEPRDFVLHLHAQLCQKVIQLQSRRATRGDLHPDWQLVQDDEQLRVDTMWVLRLAFWWAAAFAGAMIWAMFIVGRAAPLDVIGRLLDRALTWDLPAVFAFDLGAVAALGVVVPLLVAGWLRLRKRHLAVAEVLRAVLSRTRRRSDRDLLAELAARDLEQIRFLQTHTTGWSGKVTLPLKLDVTRTKTVQLAQRPLTLPEIVERLRRFMAQVADEYGVDDNTPGVVIGIDELDKVEPAEDAQRFINDLKSVFGVPRCQFLVSVSEEALTAFERRGLVFRDAFDSAFDEIVRVGYLSLRDSEDLLSKRVTGMSEPFRYLCHCLSGGLPRELIRVARNMTDLAGTIPPLKEVTQRLVGDELVRKASSMQEAAAKIGAGADVADFVRTVQSCVVHPSAETLLLKAPCVASADSPVYRLQLEARVYLRYAATLLQVFDDDFDREDLRMYSAVPEDYGSFDTLAKVLQQLATQPMVAAMTLDRFRARRRLGTAAPVFAGTFATSVLSLPAKLPKPLQQLCHCLSGGALHVLLPASHRAEALYNYDQPAPLHQVVQRLVRDDLDDKLDQLRDQVLKLGHGPDVTTLLRLVAELPARSSAAELLALAGPMPANGNRLAALRQEYRNHLRFAATLLQVFTGSEDHLDVDLDALATVPRLVGDAGEAAQALDEVRLRLDLAD